ncbi:MAG: FAD-binding oxidoreductase [Caulobacter sp.]|nr:FAD-binding oxidoreductase [Caulobacter sp.]
MIQASRRRFLTGAGAFGGAGLAGCATITPAPARPSTPTWAPVPPLAAIRAEVDRISRITVCVRPFRAAGPRLDVETVGDKQVVHNYGHGGSGWSLSWGSAMIAARNALAGGEREIAVIGCGALGLTAATVLQQAGARVTIYARERMFEARSSRATGTWSPDSRIAAVGAVAPGFADQWEQMARTSHRVFQTYLGLPGDPVEWTDRYSLFDGPSGQGGGPSQPDAVEFVEYGSRVRDLTPRSRELEAGSHPFPTARARKGASMQFNIAAYARLLATDFLLGGGSIETVTFHTPADLAALKQKVVVNCTGYGARALWKDESIVPVRGQIAWLIPQPEVNYGLYYRRVSVLSRDDGMVVQSVGSSEMAGYNIDDETPDRAEAEAAVKTIAGLYARFPAARA